MTKADRCSSVNDARSFFGCYSYKGRIDHDPFKRGIQSRIPQGQLSKIKGDYWSLTDEERYKVLTQLERRGELHTIVALTYGEKYKKYEALPYQRAPCRMFIDFLKHIKGRLDQEPVTADNIWAYRYDVREWGFYLTMIGGQYYQLDFEQLLAPALTAWLGGDNPRILDHLCDYDLDGHFGDDQFPTDPRYFKDTDSDRIPDELDVRPGDPSVLAEITDDPKYIYSERFPKSPIATVHKEGDLTIFTLKIYTEVGPSIPIDKAEGFKAYVKGLVEKFYAGLRDIRVRIEYTSSVKEAFHVVRIVRELGIKPDIGEGESYQTSDAWDISYYLGEKEMMDVSYEHVAWAHETGHLFDLDHPDERLRRQSFLGFFRFYPKGDFMNSNNLIGGWRVERDLFPRLAARAQRRFPDESDDKKKLQEAHILVDLERFDEAEALLNTVKSPDEEVLSLRAGIAYLRRRLKTAESMERKMHSMNPLSVASVNNLITVWFEMGRATKAAEMYRQLRHYHPDLLALPVHYFYYTLFGLFDYDGGYPW